jgi:hypothetical protein
MVTTERVSMNRKISKTNENLEFFNALIDEIRINGHERLRAKARLAQGEAMATAMVETIRLGKRLLKTLIARPLRRLTTSHG